jgi:glucose/arabinose dehydrogenase
VRRRVIGASGHFIKESARPAASYQGQQFPDEYHGDLFASEHGSWKKSVRTGYELIRVPLHPTGKPSGEYEDTS